ncbi:MAG: S9 family peptidase [Candidatus Acetothermia bacterium]
MQTQIDWSPEIFSKFSYPGELKISPDGKWVAYTLKRVNLEEDDYRQSINLRRIEGEDRFNLEEGSHGPTFSPDGRRLLYLKDEDESEQAEVRLLDLGTLNSHSLLKVKNPLTLNWDEEGRKIALLSRKGRADDHLYLEEEMPVWFDQHGYWDSDKYKLEILDAQSGSSLAKHEERRVVTALWHRGEVFYARARRRGDYFIYYDIFSWNGSKTQKVLEDVSLLPARSDSQGLLMTGRPHKENHTQHDYVYLWNGSEIEPLTEKYGLNNTFGINTDIWGLGIPNLGPKSDSQNRTYFVTNDAGTTKVERLIEGDKETLIGGEQVLTEFDVSDKGRMVYIPLTSDKLPEIFTWNEGSSHQLTNHNQGVAEGLDLRRSTHITYSSFDDEQIDAWYYSPEVEESAPLVVFVHGGPKGAYGYVPYYLSQILADRGMYVLHVNPRGSNTYSEDFAEEVLGDPGGGDFQDILQGIGKLIDIEEIDRNRVGITGISYGGFMTNWAITHSDLFSAAVSENGISNWFSSYSFSDIGFWFDRELIGENPFEDRSYRDRSPIFSAPEVETPTLFIHSREDYRCPMDQSIGFHHALRDLGKESYLALFKKGPHGHSRTGSPKHRLKRYKLIVEFFISKLVEEERFDIEQVLET